MPQQVPVLTYVLLTVNILVFLADWLAGRQLTMLGAKDNQAILAGEYWRLITPLFLHGGILHLGFNSYFLYVVGPQVERSFGSARFAAIYFLAGLAGTIASFALTPARSIGASGALFGVIGALIPLLYHNRDVLRNPRRQIGQIVQVIVINLVIGLAPEIDNWSHAGGLLAGVVLAWFAAPRYVIRLEGVNRVRIEDDSSLLTAWLAIGVIGLILIGLAILVIWLKRSGIVS